MNTSEVVTASNSNEGQKFITSKLKMLSGGDTITCRRGYSMQQLQFKAGKLWIQTNIMPTFTDKNTDNTSLKERIEIIEFPYSFVDDEYMIETNPDKYKKRNNEVAVPVACLRVCLLPAAAHLRAAQAGLRRGVPVQSEDGQAAVL